MSLHHTTKALHLTFESTCQSCSHSTAVQTTHRSNCYMRQLPNRLPSSESICIDPALLTLTNLELREMPACTSTMDERLSWIKSVDTTWSSVTPKIPCKECSKRYKDFCEQPDCVTSFSKCHNVVGLELATTQEKPWSHRGLAMHVQTVCSATDIVGQYHMDHQFTVQIKAL